MVPMKPAADKLLLDLVERSLSGELHASGFASASAHVPQAVQLKSGTVVVSLYRHVYRGRFRAPRGTSRQTVPLLLDEVGRALRARIGRSSDELSLR